MNLTVMETTAVRICDIPPFLQSGEFYRNLVGEYDHGRSFTESIEIPQGCLFSQTQDTNLETMCQLLKVTIFWVLDEVPSSIIEFCLRNEAEIWREPFADVPGAQESKILDALVSVYSDKSSYSFEAILKTNRWDLIRHGTQWKSKDSRATAEAAKCGNMRALRLLHEEGFVWCYDASWEASQNGHLDCLQYMHENGCPVDRTCSMRAAAAGYLHCLAYIHQQGIQFTTECSTAAASGHLLCLQFAHTNGCKWDSEVVLEAARNGHLDCLQYAHEQGLAWHTHTTTAAALGEHMDCLRYALEHGCPMTDSACDEVCGSGLLECLVLMRQHGAQWTAVTALCAAAAPDVACLAYLHTNGCPWDRYTLYNAARFGRPGNLRYAFEHGCPRDEWVPKYAVGKGEEQLACLKYLLEEQLLPMDAELFFCALLGGSLSSLQYLMETASCHMYAQILRGTFRGEVLSAMDMVLERGWVPDINLIEFFTTVDKYDTYGCGAFLTQRGYMEAEVANQTRNY